MRLQASRRRSSAPAGSGRRHGTAWDLGAAMLATTSGALPVFLIGTLAVQIRESLHFDAGLLGTTVALYYLGAATGSIPFSRLAERIGAIRVMRLAVLSSAVLTLLIALLASSWWIVLAVLIVPCGIASGAVQPAANLFLARRVAPERQGMAFGVKQAAIPSASLVGGLAVPALALTLGWRWAFGVAALLSVLAGLLLPRSTISMAARRSRPRPPQSIASIRPLIVLTVGFGLGVFAANGLAAFLVTSAVEAGISNTAAGLLAALAGATAVLVRIGLGLQVDRSDWPHFRLVAVILITGAIGCGVLAASVRGDVSWLFAVGAVIAMGIGWGWNGLFNLAVVRTYLQTPARATGILQVGGRLGGVTGPLVVGLVIAHLSYSAAWMVTGGVALIAAIIVLWGSSLLPKSSMHAR